MGNISRLLLMFVLLLSGAIISRLSQPLLFNHLFLIKSNIYYFWDGFIKYGFFATFFYIAHSSILTNKLYLKNYLITFISIGFLYPLSFSIFSFYRPYKYDCLIFAFVSFFAFSFIAAYGIFGSKSSIKNKLLFSLGWSLAMFLGQYIFSELRSQASWLTREIIRGSVFGIVGFFSSFLALFLQRHNQTIKNGLAFPSMSKSFVIALSIVLISILTSGAILFQTDKKEGKIIIARIEREKQEQERKRQEQERKRLEYERKKKEEERKRIERERKRQEAERQKKEASRTEEDRLWDELRSWKQNLREGDKVQTYSKGNWLLLVSSSTTEWYIERKYANGDFLLKNSYRGEEKVSRSAVFPPWWSESQIRKLID